MRESSDCWTYTWPFRLSGVTVLPFLVILPARNSTRYLLEVPLDPRHQAGETVLRTTSSTLEDKETQGGFNMEETQGGFMFFYNIICSNVLMFLILYYVLMLLLVLMF